MGTSSAPRIPGEAGRFAAPLVDPTYAVRDDDLVPRDQLHDRFGLLLVGLVIRVNQQVRLVVLGKVNRHQPGTRGTGELGADAVVVQCHGVVVGVANLLVVRKSEARASCPLSGTASGAMVTLP